MKLSIRLIERLLPENLSEDANAARRISFCGKRGTTRNFWKKPTRDIEFLRSEIWLPFEHRARVLNHFGYLDFTAQKVTERGKWLADVRVDRPLLVGEALRQGLFEKLETKHVAALMAALAADSDRNYGELHLSDEILEILTEFEDIVFEVSSVEWKFGVEPAPEMNFSAAATAERWADGANWERFGLRNKSGRRRFRAPSVANRRSVDANRAPERIKSARGGNCARDGGNYSARAELIISKFALIYRLGNRKLHQMLTSLKLFFLNFIEFCFVC